MAIISRTGLKGLRFGLVFFLAIRCLAGLAFASDTNAAADADGKKAETAVVNGQDSFRAYLQIQEQLHNTLLAIERSRQEAAAAAVTNAEAVETRLNNMEKEIASQRLDQLKDIQTSDRTILYAAGGFAMLGFLVLFVAAYLQWSSVNRLAAVAARLPTGPFLPAPATVDGQILPVHALEQSTTRFLSVIERLEQRIHEIEATGKSSKELPDADTLNSEIKSLTESDDEAANPEISPEKNDAITLLLRKGQTLLKLDKPEESLVCLDEALALDPGNTDVLIKRGAALERLQRLNEAIDCYDRVIALDNSMTMAYLYKGAVFNRMERYSEALQCYEQALKTRQKGEAANVIFE